MQGSIPNHFSVRGFYGVEISSRFAERLESLFRIHYGLCLGESSGRCLRFSWQQVLGTFIDVYKYEKNNGCRTGPGRIHHLAVRIHNAEAYQRIVDFYKEKGEGLIHSSQKGEFSSLYFRESEGMLFEVVGTFPCKPGAGSAGEFATEAAIVQKKPDRTVPMFQAGTLKIVELVKK